jgi:AraC family transcriptional activator of tynA and feaB
LTVQLFSTDKAPASQRAILFQRQMQERFAVRVAVSAPQEQPLSTSMMAYCGRRLRFASWRFSPHRTSACSGLPESSRLLATLQMEGTAYLSQDGREIRMGPGDLCVIDPAYPFQIETTEMLTHSVYLEREAVRAVLPEIDVLTARVINGRSGAGAIFTAMVNEMFKLAPTLDEDTANSIAEALPYALATAFTGLRHERLPLQPKLKLLHRQRIRRFVRERLRDHKLDASSIAKGVSLSARYVHELFAEETESLMKWVWSERLARCRQDLAAPSLVARSISEIAYSWGFSDMAHFSRAFRQRFGMTPREWRKQGKEATAATVAGDS